MSDRNLAKEISDILHNEGDGGIWEHFDRKNADEVAEVLAAILVYRGWKHDG